MPNLWRKIEAAVYRGAVRLNAGRLNRLKQKKYLQELVNRGNAILEEYYVPGVHVCPKCAYVLRRQVVDGATGEAKAPSATNSVNLEEDCPNGCGRLKPLTYKTAYDESLNVIGKLQERLSVYEN